MRATPPREGGAPTTPAPRATPPRERGAPTTPAPRATPPREGGEREGEVIVDALPSSSRRGARSVVEGGVVWRFSSDLHCPDCDLHYSDPGPSLFSFNSPLGACEACRGFGRVIGIDYGLIVPDESKTLREGAVKPWQTASYRECQDDLEKYAKKRGIPLDTPWRALSGEQRRWVLEGEPEWVSWNKSWPGTWYGVRRFFRWLETKAYKMHIRVLLSKYRAYTPCEACGAARLKPDALLWRLGTNEDAARVLAPEQRCKPRGIRFGAETFRRLPGLTMHDIALLPIERVREFFERLHLPAPLDEATDLLLTEIRARLAYLVEVGLGYLTLDRQSRTLSGGEVQRINLTTALGTSLVNTLFVLDEPSIGLHPRDMGRVIGVMRRLRDAGNSLVVVEHDPHVMLAADRVLDLGPGPGERGGEVVFFGAPDALKDAPRSLTAEYLSGRRGSGAVPQLPPKNGARLEILGAAEHNLKTIDVTIPLHRFVCVTGVSGSGKSTLVQDVLHAALLKRKGRPTEAPGKHRAIKGDELVGDVILVDQSPIGRTTRSNPASYVGAFDAIRKLYAEAPLARERRYTAGTFSFNSGNGRCRTCGGNGFEHVEMQFLSDVYLRCPDCDGRRYRAEVLEVMLDGKSIAGVLDLTVSEACAFFAGRREVQAALAPLAEVGLEYLRLGQPVPTLSGGEAQRLKLAGHLAEAAGTTPVLRTTPPYQGRETTPALRTTPPYQGRETTPALRTTPPYQGGETTPAQRATPPLQGGEAAGAVHALPSSPRRGGASEASDGVVHKGKLFLFDEPTTGLHFDDVAKLLRAFLRLIAAGHSLVVIEHNLDVVRAADWIVDLGPEGGDAGGEIVCSGTPREVMAHPSSHTGKALREYEAALGRVAPAAATQAAEASVRYAPVTTKPVIRIHNAREHNLKSIDVDIPRNRFTVITGVSGSGKSTLAFDILFAEGQRRYLESLNAYARQFVQPAARPDVDAIFGIPPTVAIEQRTSRGGRKSTVATLTEIYHFLRLLYMKLGTQHCPDCNAPIEPQSMEAIAARLMRDYRGTRIGILAPLVVNRKGYYTALAKSARAKGYTHLRVDGEFLPTDRWPRLDRFREHTIELPVADLRALPREEKTLREALHKALDFGNGVVHVLAPLDALERAMAEGDAALAQLNQAVFSAKRACPSCGRSFPELDPRLFSFNSKHGWCPECYGTGSRLYGFDQQQSGEEIWWNEWYGGAEEPCPACEGKRLNRQALAVRLRGRSIADLTALPVAQIETFFRSLDLRGREAEIARDIVAEVKSRLAFLDQVGLSYLALDRAAPTLSGGEAQRIRLAAQLGSNLRGVAYILDEPTIGLHPRDNRVLLDTLARLQAKGNTLVVVEHDEETIRRAEHIVDLGPGAGTGGGEVVACGAAADLIRVPASVTGRFLAQPLTHPLDARRPVNGATPALAIERARLHNLKRLDLRVPLGRLVVVTGVSGSGKSTLARDVLYENLRRQVAQRRDLPRRRKDEGRRQKAEGKSRSASRLPPPASPAPVGCRAIHGAAAVGRVLEVDQTPIGKTPRSCP
ncbi:MAG: excinuclease ABC subunit A, partial [Betaproteobacteria bacterium]|nr:excinuclease ABC subunit A [Betaproteobacteria bacterium]